MLGGLRTLFSSIAHMGSISSKLGSMGSTVYNINKVWTNPSNPEQPIHSKMTMSFLYAMHFGSIGLATAVMFGVTNTSPSLATFFVCSTALIKNIADRSVEQMYEESLAKKQSKLKKQLHVNNITFQANVVLIEDLKETHDNIEQWEKQFEENKQLLYHLNENSHPEEIKQFQIKILSAFSNSQAARSFFGEFIEDLDPKNVIGNIKIEIDQLVEKKITLTMYEFDTHDQGKRDKIKKLNQQIKQLGYIQVQCIKYKKIADSITHINKQLTCLPLNAAMDSHRTYLEERKIDLQKKLIGISQGSHESFNVLTVKDSLSLEFSKKTLGHFLQFQNYWLAKKIHQQRQQLKIKKEYFQTVVKDVITKIPQGFFTQYDSLIDLINMKNEIIQVKMKTQSKSRNINFSTISATLALVLAVVPNSDLSAILNPAMLLTGMLAGSYSLWDMYNQYRLSNNIRKNRTLQIKKIVNERRFEIAKINDPQLREELFNKLIGILDTDSSESNESNDSDQEENQQNRFIQYQSPTLNQSDDINTIENNLKPNYLKLHLH